MENLEPMIKDLKESLAEHISVIKSVFDQKITISETEKDSILRQVARYEQTASLACELQEKLEESRNLSNKLSELMKADSANTQRINELAREIELSLTEIESSYVGLPFIRIQNEKADPTGSANVC